MDVILKSRKQMNLIAANASGMGQTNGHSTRWVNPLLKMSAMAIIGLLIALSISGCSGMGYSGISGTWYQSGVVKTGTLEVSADEEAWSASYNGLAGSGSSSGIVTAEGGNEYEFARGANGDKGRMTMTLSSDGSRLSCSTSAANADIGGVWYRSEKEAQDNSN